MQIGEAKLSALAVSFLTGVGLTIVLNQALHDFGFALTITIPITLVMGAVLFVFASDNIKTGGDKPPKGN
jgi:preprotein translocase subunit SecY